jgi:hypothetical protein
MLKNKYGQITIFVIIAIVILVAIGGYFLFKGALFDAKIPQEFVPVYDYYESCLEARAQEGAKVLGSQGGYYELPDFEPGSEYAPFSNQLDFMGFGVPYWYYVSGNGIIKEQVPSKNELERQLELYLEDNVVDCDFSLFNAQGYDVVLGEAEVDVDIKDNEISMNVNQDLIVEKQGSENSLILKNHNIKADSNLGRFYETAKKIYSFELEESFLEDYTKDILFLYAPVAGSEFSCEEKIWDPAEVLENLTMALEANMANLRVNGEYYDVDKTEEYFVVDPGIKLSSEQVNFIYDNDWAYRFEVWPTENNIMKAEQVGAKQGLGFLGFCYNVYKFVYDLSFPVMVQVMDSKGEEVFQFPVSVIIDKNNPREAMVGGTLDGTQSICENTNAEIDVYTYNTNLDKISADIEFKCLDSRCSLGTTGVDNGGLVDVGVPACLNAEIIANAEGYAEQRSVVNTNEIDFVDMILEKEYELQVEVYVDGQRTQESSLIYFEGSKMQSISYPQEDKIILDEGQYEITAYVMKQGEIVIPAKVSTQCTQVREGFAGLLGFESERCFDVEIPSMTLNNVFYAGGSTDYYAVESKLGESNILRIYANSFNVPTSVEELQETFDLLEGGRIDIQVI